MLNDLNNDLIRYGKILTTQDFYIKGGHYHTIRLIEYDNQILQSTMLDGNCISIIILIEKDVD